MSQNPTTTRRRSTTPSSGPAQLVHGSFEAERLPPSSMQDSSAKSTSHQMETPQCCDNDFEGTTSNVDNTKSDCIYTPTEIRCAFEASDPSSKDAQASDSLDNTFSENLVYINYLRRFPVDTIDPALYAPYIKRDEILPLIALSELFLDFEFDADEIKDLIQALMESNCELSEDELWGLIENDLIPFLGGTLVYPEGEQDAYPPGWLLENIMSRRKRMQVWYGRLLMAPMAGLLWCFTVRYLHKLWEEEIVPELRKARNTGNFRVRRLELVLIDPEDLEDDH